MADASEPGDAPLGDPGKPDPSARELTARALASAGPWTGASGRLYQVAPDAETRQGAVHRVVAVVGRGEGKALPPGRKAALMMPARTSAAALEAFEQEVASLERLSSGTAASPAPRLHDRLAEGHGAIVEWCPTDLERWWLQTAREAEGFRNLCLALADACRRLADWSAAARKDPTLPDAPPRIRPRAILRTAGGRWVLSGFGRGGGPLAPLDSDAGTDMLTAAGGYDPPELLFAARSEHPAARHTWAIGATLLALLKVRALMHPEGDSRELELPAGGTDSPHLRSHRAALIDDLLQRKPALFTDRPLDPRQFLYPDRLPDRDRRTVGDALAGLFGEPQEALEGQLTKEVLKVLDSALSIDPGRRYLDPLIMAGDLEGLARRYRVMRSTVAAARYAAPAGPDDATRLFGDDPTEEQPLPTSAFEPLDDRSVSITAEAEALIEPLRDEDTADAATDMGVDIIDELDELDELDDPPAGDDAAPVPPAPPVASLSTRSTMTTDPGGPVEDAPTVVGFDDTASAGVPPGAYAAGMHDDPLPPPSGSAPGWVKGALGVLVTSQLLTLVLVGFLWTELQAARQQPAVEQSAATQLLQGLAEDAPSEGAGEGSAAAPAEDDAVEDEAVEEEPVEEEPVEEEPVEEEPVEAEPVADQPIEADPVQPQPAAKPATTQPPPAPPETARPSTSSSSTARQPQPEPAAAAPEPAAAAEPAAEPTAPSPPQDAGATSITVEGAESWLQGPSGRVSTGAVPPGTYGVMIKEGAGWTKAVTVTVEAGQQALVRCGFSQCKQVR